MEFEKECLQDGDLGEQNTTLLLCTACSCMYGVNSFNNPFPYLGQSVKVKSDFLVQSSLKEEIPNTQIW